MAKVLVTGAAGFVGSHTVEGLLEAGHEVTGVDNMSTGREENLASFAGHRHWRLIQQDILDVQSFFRSVGTAKPDVIVHLAALVSVRESMANPSLNFEQNIRAVQVVADAAAKAGVRRLIFASSAAVYGDSGEVPFAEESATRPLNPYGEAKLAGESLVLEQGRARGFEAVCLRYFNVYGPRQPGDSPYSGVVSRFIDRLRNGKPPLIFGDGKQTRDFIHVHDVARANVLAASIPVPLAGIFNICTGHELAIDELAAAFRRQFPSLLMPIYEPALAGEIKRSIGRPERARDILGFSAQIAVSTGLQEFQLLPESRLKNNESCSSLQH